MGQLTRVLPRKACSTRAALIWRTLVECIDSCVGYLAHPFVKRMILLLLSSFFSQL
jgi:hypothetical protein